jgi:hypothetical protein
MKWGQNLICALNEVWLSVHRVSLTCSTVWRGDNGVSFYSSPQLRSVSAAVRRLKTCRYSLKMRPYVCRKLPAPVDFATAHASLFAFILQIQLLSGANSKSTHTLQNTKQVRRHLKILSVPFTRTTVNTLRTGLLNCLNARSRGLIFRHRAFCI